MSKHFSKYLKYVQPRMTISLNNQKLWMDKRKKLIIEQMLLVIKNVT